MGKVRVKMNRAGARALLTGGDVQADLLRRAGAIQDAANAGIMSAPDDELFQASVFEGKNRARASVITGGFASMKANAKSNVLLKSVDRGRT